VIGRTLQPKSQAVTADGKPDLKFRAAAEALWKAAASRIDFRGRPGQGGQTVSDLAGVALLNVILSGGILYRFRYDSGDKTSQGSRSRGGRRQMPPIRVQLIHNNRLDESVERYGTNDVFFGIELNADDQRVAYHLHESALYSQRRNSLQSKRVLADDVGHLFVGDDADQLRGVPWFSTALLKLRDVGDYEFNELQAAAMAACVVLGYRRSAGHGDFGVQPNEEWDLTDADGNPITDIRPGMLVDLGATGQLDGFNPQRPNTNAVEFLTHQLRSVASGVPGIKSSTIIGDYRRASFASERAADNDTWPEIEVLQDWFSSGFSQPIYERLVVEGVQSGWFDDVPGFKIEEFEARQEQYLSTSWNGPVPRSINPVDDAKAATLRVSGATSSPQREAALTGTGSCEDNLKDVSEFIAMCGKLKIPEVLMYQMLGIEQQVVQEDIGEPVEPATDDDPDSV